LIEEADQLACEIRGRSPKIFRAWGLDGDVQGTRPALCTNFNPLDELMMNFFAGLETTAATLDLPSDRLGIDPRVEQRLHDEIHAGRGEPYLDCFVQETLRYFPTIPVRRKTGSFGHSG